MRNAYNINPLEENELRSGKIEADEDFKVNYLHIEPVADSEVGDDKSSSDSDTPLLVAEEGYFYNALRVGQADNDDSSFTVAGDVTVNYNRITSYNVCYTKLLRGKRREPTYGTGMRQS